MISKVSKALMDGCINRPPNTFTCSDANLASGKNKN